MPAGGPIKPHIAKIGLAMCIICIIMCVGYLAFHA